MNIGRFSIKQTHFILALTIAIVILGAYSKVTLKTQLAPDTNPPTATVITQYPGATAEDVIKDITEPMEDEFGELDGISSISSVGQNNISIMSLEFSYSRDIDAATIDIQNAISRIKDKLPSSISEPQVLKFSTSGKPVLTVGLKSDLIDMRNIRQITENEIKSELQLVDGIASIDVFGGYDSLVKVNINKNKLLSYNLTLEQVSQILVQNNVKAPGGKLTDSNKEVLIRIEEDLKTINDIKNIKIPLVDGNSILLQDIADISLSTGDLESSYRLNGEVAISMLITKRGDANTVEVVDNTKEALEDLQAEYPFLEFEIAQDDSVFTNQMVDNMTSSVLAAIILTIIVIILFISNIAISIVVALSMPLVFLMTLGLMKLTGMNLDMVTLSALILSIGFVVDAAIVVVENIMTHRKDKGKSLVNATIDAINEIAAPSIAGAATTLAVLVPLLFIEGFVGEMFRPLSLTLIYAISSSILVALIIIPLFTIMLGRFKFEKTEKLVKKVSIPFNNMMDKLLEFYIRTLKMSLNHKKIVLLISLVLMVLSGLFLKNNGIEMLPKFDSGVTFISLEMESGSSLGETIESVEQIESFLNNEDNVQNYDTQIGFEQGSKVMSDFEGVIGTNQAFMTINLNTRKERKETIWEFQDRLRQNIDKIPGIQRFVVKEQGGTATTSSKAPIDIKISGDDQKVLYSVAKDLQEKVTKIEGTTNLYKSFNINDLQLNIKFDDKRVQELGLTNAAIAKQIATSMNGLVVSNMNINEMKNVDISVQYEDEKRNSIDELLDIYIDSPLGIKVPLREVARIETEEVAGVITREDFQYTINVLGYTQDRAFSHIIQDVNEIIQNHPLPNGYSVELAGEQQELQNSMKDMAFLMILAIILVYLILVSSLKSFLHPITIMIAIPLAIIGIAPALGLTGKYISMPVLLSFILLAGIAVNDAILLLENILIQREHGLEMNDAIIKAVRLRYRAIMMTTISDISGMLPLAMQLALGSERFSPLAISVSGGMIASTFLTIIVTPVIYASFEEIKVKFTRKRIKA